MTTPASRLAEGEAAPAVGAAPVGRTGAAGLILALVLLLGARPLRAAEDLPEGMPRFARLHLAVPLRGAEPALPVPAAERERLPADTALFDFRAETPRPAACRLRTRLGRHPEGLYLFLHNPEPRMKALRARVTERDAPDLWRDDAVEIYLAPGPDAATRYYKLTVNSLGTLADARWTRAGGTDATWDAEGLALRVQRHAAAWTVEAFLPWSAVDAAADATAVWRFAVVRLQYTDGERFGATAPGARFDRPGAFGYLLFAAEAAPAPARLAARLRKAAGADRLAPWGERCLRTAPGAAPAGRTVEVLQELQARLARRCGRAAEELPGAERRRLLTSLAAAVGDLPAPGGEPVTAAMRLATLRRLAGRLASLSYTETVMEKKPDPRTGAQVYALSSPYIEGPREVRVLAPTDYDPESPCRVLYILPVEAGFGTRFGYGLGVLAGLQAQDRHNLLLVQPGFARAPWYGDHATDPLVRQASYLREAVLPFVEERWATVPGPEGRLLFGFSKSGWGAVSLLLREPRVYGYAAVWDAPLMFERFHYGMEAVFGAPEQLARYRPDRLAAGAIDESFRRRPRLVLGGEKLWGRLVPPPTGQSHTAAFHRLLTKHGVRHRYRPDLPAPHRWDAAWAGPLLEALLSIVNETAAPDAAGPARP